MTTYQIEFGNLGDTRPVPPLTVTADDDTALCRAVAAHAIPHITPVLAAMGRPELADCMFQLNRDRTAGQFLWLDLAGGQGTRFLGARVTPAAAEEVEETLVTVPPQYVRREEQMRTSLETGFTDQPGAVGMVLCPARERCTSTVGMRALFKPLKDGRVPMHRDRWGYACSGAHSRPTTPPLKLRTGTAPAGAEAVEETR